MTQTSCADTRENSSREFYIGQVIDHFTLRSRNYSGSRWYVECRCGLGRNHAVEAIAAGRIRCRVCDKDRPLPPLPVRADMAEYKAWLNMIARCTNPDHSSWRHYGGRGITVCEEWRKSYSAFMRDMGSRPSSGHSIDRIDNDGNYEPSNCRWATAKQQVNNRRPSSEFKRRGKKYSFNGLSLTAAEWAERLGVPKPRLEYRLKNWPIENALTGKKPVSTLKKQAESIGITVSGLKNRLERMSLEEALSTPRYVHRHSRKTR